MKHVIFNLSMNLTDEKCSLSEDWDFGILSVDWGKKQFLPENGAHIRAQILAKESPA